MFKIGVILFSVILLWGCALTGYKTIPLISEKDEYTGKEILDSRISFPQATSQTLVIFRQVKNGETTSNFLVGKLWMEDWGFIKSVDILIDNNNHHVEAFDTKRNVLNNASVEEIIYFDINNEIINELSKCGSLKIRFNGEKNVRECIFDSDKIRILKTWIDHVKKS